MGNKNVKKTSKKQQTGGLQPKGGAYANQNAKLAAGAVTVGVKQNSTLKEKKRVDKEKVKAEKEKAKQKKAEKKEKKGMVKALRETGAELKKVRWPGFGKTLKQTGVVLSVVVIFGLVVFGLDRALSALYQLLTKGYN